MAAAGEKVGVEGVGREVVFTRTFDAPRGVVFRAWTDPEALARWWGPKGFTNPVCEADARPGGAIRIDMTGPDGTVYPMTGVFREVVEPERVSFSCFAHPDESGEPQLEVLNTASFAEHDGRTTLTLRAVLVKASPEAAHAAAGMEQGWKQSLDRLEAEVSRGHAEADDVAFVVTRDFDAPRSLVFRAWTEADRLAQWFGPKGATLAQSKLDLRPGGLYLVSMTSPDGKTLWGRWVFREVVPPERLAFVHSFSDESGGVTRSPFSPDWPLEVLTTLTFTERDGRTTLTLRGVPLNASPTERQAFAAANASMQGGWAGTFDKLGEYLAQS